MAQPNPKRRKTSHDHSSDEEDAASFASFNDGSEEESSGSPAPDAADSEELSSEDDRFNEDGEDRSAGVVSGDDEQDLTNGNGHTGKVTANTTPQNGAHGRQSTSAKAQALASTFASGTFKSNIFKLQVDELLDNIRPKQGKREAEAEAAVHALKAFIEKIPSCGPFSIDEAERSLLKNKVAIPFPDPRPSQSAKYKFAFAKPAIINVVGSFALKTASKSQSVVEVDMILVMPSSLFDEKDFLDYRYFYKRAYYLAYVASKLKDQQFTKYRIRFRSFHDNPLMPVLVVEPAQAGAKIAKSATNWKINILPCIGRDQFAASKVLPGKSCIRTAPTNKTITAEESARSTPLYNAALRSDMLMTDYLKLLHAAKKNCAAFGDACLLGSTWLRQRGFGSAISLGGFGNFEWNALMAVCLQAGGPGGRPLLSDAYSSYQLFKAVLQLLAMKDVLKKPLRLGNAQDELDVAPLSIPIIWDVHRGHNILFKMSPWSYQALKHEARTTLDALGDQSSDGFDATFIMKVHDPSFRFDITVEIARGAKSFDHFVASSDDNEYLTKLYDVLKRGLSDRVRRIQIEKPAHEPWELGSSRPRAPRADRVVIGVVVSPNTIRRTVDQGPPAEKKEESAAFRSFWGEKAELRRFKDGSILESLVWSPSDKGVPVFEQVVRYILHRHFNINTIEDVQFFGDCADKLIRGGSDIALFGDIMSRYTRFENDVRNLPDLPLAIRQIRPADAQVRYCALLPPSMTRSVLRSKPADITIQFEGTSRWPDDLVAIQRTKIALLLKLSELIESNISGVTARIGLENEHHDILNQAYIDVLYDSDATFRVRIHHDREQTLLERQLKDKSASPKTNETAAIGLAQYKRLYVKTPAHTQTLTRLCLRHPALSGTIRLAKRWFASHLLSNHIAEEVIEMIVARTFLHPSPWQTPSSVQTAFLRTLLWISRWDWRNEPLIVDLSDGGELKLDDRQAITTRFEAWRKLDPALHRVCLFAASNVDPDGTTWTDGAPAKVVAGRMTALAKAACAEISAHQMHLNVGSLFSSPLHDFDFALHLSANATGSRSNRNGPAFKNLDLALASGEEAIGFEPVQDLLHELETLYGSAVVFFSGGDERPVIAGLWNPQTVQRAWKVNLAYSTIPTKSAGEGHGDATVNKTAMLAEMARLGSDLIEKVEIFEH